LRYLQKKGTMTVYERTKPGAVDKMVNKSTIWDMSRPLPAERNYVTISIKAVELGNRDLTWKWLVFSDAN
jgi:hypothetical protein